MGYVGQLCRSHHCAYGFIAESFMCACSVSANNTIPLSLFAIIFPTVRRILLYGSDWTVWFFDKNKKNIDISTSFKKKETVTLLVTKGIILEKRWRRMASQIPWSGIGRNKYQEKCNDRNPSREGGYCHTKAIRGKSSANNELKNAFLACATREQPIRTPLYVVDT